jgi:hypothetical protein
MDWRVGGRGGEILDKPMPIGEAHCDTWDENGLAVWSLRPGRRGAARGGAVGSEFLWRLDGCGTLALIEPSGSGAGECPCALLGLGRLTSAFGGRSGGA